ncbi:general stress protein [Paenibacillus sp. HN-1]|uniref:general stress protein n=1 Tax=Paenibacillus TaxID=44249 RepID=UPI001CA95D09|nr:MULTISPECIES: general stress protein [Paenibacillus]MBY9078478.1 general stress protein [Paenibacillus sp. CGMCC 1.18879]MBY9082771.1 general stress protein [Paenibacillus sinensis]
MTRKIIGIFETEREATKAIQELQARGIPNEEISVVTKDRDELNTITEETATMAPEGVATGAATGGVVGGLAGLLAGIGALAIPGIGPFIVAGPIAALLTGAALGAGAGGLVGGLVGLGIPEDEAKEYEGYVNEGKIMVLVDDDGRDSDIHNIFRGNRSLNANRYSSQVTDNTRSSGQDATMVGSSAGNLGPVNADTNPDLDDRSGTKDRFH